MQHVIGKFLADHKLTVMHLLETPHTKKIIEKARDNKEISRFEIKKPRTTKKVEKEAAPVVQEKANVEWRCVGCENFQIFKNLNFIR